jgi:acyl carrier protein
MNENPRELEAAVAEIWAEILGVDEVGLHDNFLLLGGESLLATQVVSQIRSKLGCEISIRSIFVGTVAEVAAEIGTLRAATPA